MSNTKTITKQGTVDRYTTYLEPTISRPRGRRPNKIHNTMINLEIGEKFFYPYTTPTSVYRKAKQIDIFVQVKAKGHGFWVARIG